ncbi:MAG: hypothetical protein HY550_02550 [Elusimicrobia bacterium]|nr:hypothetical protein [Elusimicrobiota bacterium]
MRKEERLKLIAGSDLPAGLKTYLLGVLAGNRPFSLGAALKKDPEGFLAGIRGLLREAGLALGRPAAEALRLGGFDGNNLAPDRLEAALAELLAVVFLRSEGFSGTGFIGRGAGKTADISASRGGLEYAFEVCSARTKAAGLTVDLLERKYDKKIGQAKASGRKRGLRRVGLVLIAGPLSFSGFEQDELLAGLARGLYERKKSPSATHICLLAGGRAAVAPPWEDRAGPRALTSFP